MVDLTKDGFDDDSVKAYLRLGPDFNETPKQIPYEKIIVETEKCSSQMRRTKREILARKRSPHTNINIININIINTLYLLRPVDVRRVDAVF